MINKKKLGIWMDHATAQYMEFDGESKDIITLESQFTHEDKENSLRKSESLMHNKEQQEQAGYYKKIGEVIQNFDEVLLFGPTNAKVELLNILKADHHFDKIKIETMQADKMTENQQHAFVKEYYTNL